MSEYVWYKDGKEIERTLDWNRKHPTKVITGDGTYIVYTYNNGRMGIEVSSEKYYKNGQLHRGGDKPAVTWYYEGGNDVEQHQYWVDGVRHRESTNKELGILPPAIIEYTRNGGVMNSRYYYKGKRVEG